MPDKYEFIVGEDVVCLQCSDFCLLSDKPLFVVGKVYRVSRMLRDYHKVSDFFFAKDEEGVERFIYSTDFVPLRILGEPSQFM